MAAPADAATMHMPSVGSPSRSQQGIDGVAIAADYSPYMDWVVGDDDMTLASNSTSLASSVTNYKYENGRRYHAYREGVYILPNDQAENDRLDLQHQILNMVFGLHRAPLKNPKKILDLGTGTGIWAYEMADKFPAAEVYGIDLSPIQPSWVPPNLSFAIDDAESTWSYGKESFSYIHTRYMVGSIHDWPRLISQAFSHLVPGGYFEMQEVHSRIYSDDNSLPANSAIKKWNELFVEGARINKRLLDIGPEMKGMVENGGFINVQQEVYKLPLSAWPKDPRLKEIGRLSHINTLEGLQALTLALFTRVHGWALEEVEAFLLEVRKDLHNKRIHMLCDIYIVWGKKPT